MFGRILLLAAVALVLWGVVAHSSSGAGREQSYVVRPHDTLWSIASRFYGGDPREGIWRLERRNGLGDALLVPGQRLIVPSS
jgi:nucleoid-associated protein YgaU